MTKREAVRGPRILEAQVNKQLILLNNKLEILTRAKEVYQHPIPESKLIEIERVIKSIKLARDKGWIDETQIALNAKLLQNIDEEERSI